MKYEVQLTCNKERYKSAAEVTTRTFKPKISTPINNELGTLPKEKKPSQKKKTQPSKKTKKQKTKNRKNQKPKHTTSKVTLHLLEN